MANIDDEPAKFSELDLSEDAAITGDDVSDALAVSEGSVVKADPDAETFDEDESSDESFSSGTH